MSGDWSSDVCSSDLHRSPRHPILTRLGVLRGSSCGVLCRHFRASSISMVRISFLLSSLNCWFHVLMITSTGAYMGHDMSGQQASSGSWESDEAGGYTQNPQEMQSQWFEQGYYTPPPGPTQDTQYAQDGSLIQMRPLQYPDRWMWTPRGQPPFREDRRRQG